MAILIKSLFGQNTPMSVTDDMSENQTHDQTQRGLPASWYSSKNMYEIERRAIFSQKWMMVTHKHRLVKSGDYASFTIAGYSFFLCVDKIGTIRGFHNICRHRGFPLIHNESGNIKILSCKYHGWSYGINGKLAKAPHFDGIADFKKEENGLLPVHVHVDQLGFVWVNLDASQTPKTSWSEDFLGVDTQDRLQSFDLTQYRFDHSWKADGKFNWKTLADNYNECLHCKVAHPDVAGLADVTVYKVEGQNSSLKHYTNMKGHTGGRDVTIASTYLFPNSLMTVSPHFFYLMRCVPTSEHTCSLEYEVYRHNEASDVEFEHIDSLFKRILTEDKWLCDETQKNLDAGVFVNGQLHPSYEEGPLYFQKLVRKCLMDHHAEEQKLKAEIWPARQTSDERGSSNVDVEFCSALDSTHCGKGVEW